MINGNDPDTLADHLKLAQKRLADACMKLPLHPNNAGISAFVNGAILNAKINALIEYTAPFEFDESGSPVMKATFDETLLKHLERDAEQLEGAVREAPRIVTTTAVAGHG